MIKTHHRWHNRIWSLLSVIATALIVVVWMLVALAVFALDNARSTVTEMTETVVPDLSQASRLASQAADLAILSNRILFLDTLTGASLTTAADNLNYYLTDNLNHPRLQQEKNEILSEMDRVLLRLSRGQQLEDETRALVTQLRWVDIEIEEEIAALIADFSYNIGARMDSLVSATSLSERDARARSIDSELALRDALYALSDSFGTAFSLGVQTSTTSSQDQLRQLKAIQSDELARAKTLLDQLPETAEYVTLRQSARLMNELVQGPDGITLKREEWHHERASLHRGLERLLSQLLTLQRGLQSDVTAEEIRLVSMALELQELTQTEIFALSLATGISVIAAAAILLFYIRPKIVHPVQQISGDLRALVQGQRIEPTPPPTKPGEITDLFEAVQGFANALRERDMVLADLQRTSDHLLTASKMAALGTISISIGRELSPPLTTMQKRLELLRDVCDSGDRVGQDQQLRKLDELVGRLWHTVTDLTRIAQRRELVFEAVPLLPVAVSARAFVENHRSHHRVPCSIDPTLENVVFTGDKLLVEQLIATLLQVSAATIEASGAPGRIKIHRDPAPEGYAAFSVQTIGTNLQEPIAYSSDHVPATADVGDRRSLALAETIIGCLDGNVVQIKESNGNIYTSITLPRG
ncbi:hypothetical protein [Palleronia caenipelagi]|uniref:HAMP domain-containing protein n=1 Tax=Palleronia caenipelagi TaxID=2489174 RepID=A0A547PXP4_9RHOB|nr:hypothetical protein [Palleronia caenipelagi]TRD18931.1 hypothetical protein FEV53_11250 [Palleronia caenipelagi]